MCMHVLCVCVCVSGVKLYACMSVSVCACVHAFVCVFGIVSRTGACLSQRGTIKHSTVEEKWTEVH